MVEPKTSVGRSQIFKVTPPHPKIILLPTAPKRLFCFGSFMVLVVVCGDLFFLLGVKSKNRYKWMFNVRLAGDSQYGKWLFTWLSLVMFLMMSDLYAVLR